MVPRGPDWAPTSHEEWMGGADLVTDGFEVVDGTGVVRVADGVWLSDGLAGPLEHAARYARPRTTTKSRFIESVTLRGEPWEATVSARAVGPRPSSLEVREKGSLATALRRTARRIRPRRPWIHGLRPEAPPTERSRH